jgi:hypothetical protein
MIAMLKTTECCLCSQIAGEEFNDLIARMLNGEPYVRRVMLESRSFAAIPSLGPLVSGHPLLCPRMHVRSFADHAHMHFVPLPCSCVVDGIEQLAWTEFDGSLRELTQLSQGREYILYEPPDGVCRLLIAGERSFESQYMRKLLAQALGHRENWNWRDNPDPRSADETWRRFAL